MLRTDIHYEIVFLEDAALALNELAFVVEAVNVGKVGLALVFNRHGVDFRIGIVVLTHGIAYPVEVEEQAAHIAVAHEDDTEEIVYFAFVETGHMPHVFHRVYPGFLAVALGNNLHTDNIVCLCRHQIVYSAEVFGPVHAYHGNAVVEFEIGVVAEGESHIMPLLFGDSHQRGGIAFDCSGGEEGLYLLDEISHNRN